MKIVSVLDKCKVSDRDAVHLLTAFAEALGHDLYTLSISRSTIRRCRQKLRKERAENIKKLLNKTEVTAAVIHWDGKILPAITGKEKVERLAIILTNGDEEALLGVPILPNGTGKGQADAVYQSLREWGLDNEVKALCFDTTATNTGYINGACTLLEQNLNTNLMYLPCRHHIFEIILKSVFDVKMPASSGPHVPIFKRFQDSWKNIRKTNFKPGIDSEYIKNSLDDVCDDILKFVKDTLQLQQPREDYRELLQLTEIFLGNSSDNTSIRAPGAFHHARWMSKAIYTLKIFLFRNEFKLTLKEILSLSDICIFIVKVYVKAWFTAPFAIKAPYHDLEFLKKLMNYKNVDPVISDTSVDKMLNHLWYLNTENIALAFFDDNVSNQVKTDMVKALTDTEVLEDDIRYKRVLLKKSDLEYFLNKPLSDFVSCGTKSFFRRFNIDLDFLNNDPETWKSDNRYTKAFDVVNKLKVVNDSAERGIKLISEYSSILTQNEEQKQYLLKVVTDYRRRYPDAKKSTVIKPLE